MLQFSCNVQISNNFLNGEVCYSMCAVCVLSKIHVDDGRLAEVAYEIKFANRSTSL